MKKQTKMACLILAFAAVLNGCKKNDIRSDSDVLMKGNSKLSAADEKWDVLGYGLDVTFDFLDPNGRSDVSIFDLKQFETDFRDRIDDKINVDRGSYGTDHIHSGYSAFDYLKDVSNTRSFDAEGNAKIAGTKKTEGTTTTTTPELNFSASLKTSSTNQNINTYSTKYSYASVESRRQVKRIRFTGDVSMDLLKQYLTPAFLNNVATQSADDLVQRYGTHVMLDISIGGTLRLKYSGVVKGSSNLEKKTNASTGLSLSAFGIGIKIGSDKSKEEITKIITESREKEYTGRYYGGTNSGQSISINQDGQTTESINLASFQQSINAGNAVLIDVGRAVFLYDFITDPVKKAAVKVAVEKHIKDSQIKLAPQEVYEFSTPLLNKHANSLDPNMHLKYLSGGWNPNGQPFKAYPEAYNGSVPVYQFTNQATSDRFLSTDRNFSVPNYSYDGILFYAYNYQAPGTVPIYQLAYPRNPDHFYHPDRNVIAPFVGWQVDGVAFWAFNN